METKLTASDGDQSDYFGYSVSIDGDAAIVGSYGDDDNGYNSGSAYIYRLIKGVWIEETKLLASDGAYDDYFGRSNAISGDTVIVGAYGDDQTNGESSGSVYIFGTEDCNGNGLADSTDIAKGFSDDCDQNGVPDECQPDCDDDGVIDICDDDLDCDGDGISDTCESDCNENSYPDDCDVIEGISLDENGDGIPDECQDCNGNGILDPEDISNGTSDDLDGNGMPDECQPSVLWTVDDDGNADFQSIAEAVAMAGYFDEIVVFPGTYSGMINTFGKGIWLHSNDGPESTIIDGEGNGWGIRCISGETNDTRIEGFTITNCVSNGMYFDESSPTVINCSFYNNSSWTNGAGIRCYYSNPIITSCSFISNSNTLEYYPGAAVASIYSNPVITDTYFCDNWPTHMIGDWTDGGGTCFSFSCNDSDGDGRPDECDTVGDGVHHVPEEYKTIQEAIYAAGDHDEIIVGPGTYTCEDTGSWIETVIHPGGKRLWIHSSDGPELTVIDIRDDSAGLLVYSGETTETLIEGFTFSSSGQNWSYNAYCFWSSPTIRDCIISNSNYVGMDVSWGSPTITNCTFLNNNNGYGNGGGMILRGAGTPTVANCSFEGNSAYQGGGISIEGDGYSQSFLPVISNCTFSNNSATAQYGGGGLYASGGTSDGSRLTLTDCTFENNAAGGWGGGTSISNWDMTMTNCSFTNNTSLSYGGGIFFYPDINSNDYSFIDNCIVKNNNANSGGGIGTLMWNHEEFIISDTIVCGNTPDNFYDVFGWDSYTDGGGNIVADVCLEDCPDINGDGYVSVSDLLAIIDQWGLADSPADVNADGIVDVTDLLMVVGSWGPCE